MVERYCYYAVSVAETEQDIQEARSMLRLTVGLRRKLDALKEEG